MWQHYLSIGVEFCLLSLLVYGVLSHLRETRAVNVLLGLVVCLLVLRFLAERVGFELVQLLFDKLGIVLAMVAVVIFQPELRRAFAQLGRIGSFRKKWDRETIVEIGIAVREMARQKTGAIIVLERRDGLRELVEDSIPLDCSTGALLLQSIFYPNSPLHDGAVIVRNDRIVAARAILPLSHNVASRMMGTRHRAALGITESGCDAVAVVVSEENGKISVAHDGEFLKEFPPEELEARLTEVMSRRRVNLPALKDAGNDASSAAFPEGSPVPFPEEGRPHGR